MCASRATRSKGLPAAAILAGGISRHGAHCGCRYCRVEVELEEIDDGGVLNPPVEIPPRREDDAISAAFEATRDAIARRLESK